MLNLTKDKENINFFIKLHILSGLPPSQGGRYSGFGNTVDPPKNDSNDFFSSFSSVIILIKIKRISKLNYFDF